MTNKYESQHMYSLLTETKKEQFFYASPLVSLTNWQQQIPGGDELPDQPDAQHGLPTQHQQRHRHVHRNCLLLPQVSPNFINSSVFLSKYHLDMIQMFE